MGNCNYSTRTLSRKNQGSARSAVNLQFWMKFRTPDPGRNVNPTFITLAAGLEPAVANGCYGFTNRIVVENQRWRDTMEGFHSTIKVRQIDLAYAVKLFEQLHGGPQMRTKRAAGPFFL